MGRVWETAERRDLATSLTLRDVRGEGGPARGHVPSPLRAITGRKPRNETRPSGGEIAEKRLEGAECAGIGMLPAERSSMKVYIFTSAPNERVLRVTQLAKLSFNHPSVVVTADVLQYFYEM